MKTIALLLLTVFLPGLTSAQDEHIIAKISGKKNQLEIKRAYSRFSAEQKALLSTHSQKNILTIGAEAEFELIFADELENKSTSFEKIELNGEEYISLAPNAKIQLMYDLEELSRSQKSHPSIHLKEGELFIKASKQKLTIVTQATKYQLDNFEGIIHKKALEDEVYILRGTLSYRFLSEEEIDTYAQLLHTIHYEKLSMAKLKKLTIVEKNKKSFLNSGFKYNLSRLDPNRVHESKQMIASDVLAQKVLLTEYLDDYTEYLDDYTEYHTKEVKVLTINSSYSQTNNEESSLSIQPSLLAIRSSFSKEASISSQALSLQVNYRPWKYVYSYLGLASGKTDARLLDGYLGEGKPESLNGYSQLAGGLGLSFPITSFLGLDLGMAWLKSQKIILRYEDLPTNINQNFRLDFTPIVAQEASLYFQLNKRLSLSLKYAKAQARSIIYAESSDESYGIETEHEFACIGINFS